MVAPGLNMIINVLCAVQKNTQYCNYGMAYFNRVGIAKRKDGLLSDCQDLLNDSLKGTVKNEIIRSKARTL